MDWMQMGNQILDKPHHIMPSGLKFELAAETPPLMILFNSLSQQILPAPSPGANRLRNWDYDFADAIIRGEVDIGFADVKRIRAHGSSQPAAVVYRF